MSGLWLPSIPEVGFRYGAGADRVELRRDGDLVKKIPQS